MTREQKLAVCDILKYIQKQPQAKHTAEGIAMHWISQQRIEENIKITISAIDYLVANGFLEKVRKEDAGFYYRVNQSKITTIDEMIESLEDQLRKQ